MKKVLIALLVALFPLTADAGWNLRQKDTGETEWVREYGGAQQTIEVGESYVTVMLENVSSASTNYLPSPITSARVSRIVAVMQGAITGDTANINFYKLNSAGDFVGEITNGTSALAITSASMQAGLTFTFTPSDNTANNYMEQDSVIAIATDGGSSSDIDVNFVVTIVPR